jgi:phosphoribosylaminoimidazolecarboxamide formyltransferase / IMP cyclohydrolase
MERNALLSVYDKTGIVEFARELISLGWRIISSGGTARELSSAGLPVTDVCEISGMPPVLRHRVVTLVPQIHGGLLAEEQDRDELAELGYPWIDLVCVDLYPLGEETRQPDATRESVIEKTDIGGPTLLRSAAKGRRIVIADPSDRAYVLSWLKEGEQCSDLVRNTLAVKAELVVAGYSTTSATFHLTH